MIKGREYRYSRIIRNNNDEEYCKKLLSTKISNLLKKLNDYYTCRDMKELKNSSCSIDNVLSELATIKERLIDDSFIKKGSRLTKKEGQKKEELRIFLKDNESAMLLEDQIEFFPSEDRVIEKLLVSDVNNNKAHLLKNKFYKFKSGRELPKHDYLINGKNSVYYFSLMTASLAYLLIRKSRGGFISEIDISHAGKESLPHKLLNSEAFLVYDKYSDLAKSNILQGMMDLYYAYKTNSNMLNKRKELSNLREELCEIESTLEKLFYKKNNVEF